MGRFTAFGVLISALVLTGLPAAAVPPPPPHVPVAEGTGGAVATVDPDATAAALAILRRGGNAVDAAVAAAAALGVTEPYSAGIGGGGFMVIALPGGDVVTIDGREEAPEDPAFDADVFISPATGQPLAFADAVNSGLSVGVPGTLATWVAALESYGTISLAQALQPAVVIARSGFIVDATFAEQTQANAARFRQITPTAELFLPGGAPPAVGSRFRNRDLAATYQLLQREGPDAFYSGALGAEIVATAQQPPTSPNATEVWQPGLITLDDLAGYEALTPPPTHSQFLGYDIYGMGPPSSGGTTVGETLNIVEGFDLSGATDADFWHLQLEATALAFADRNAYVADGRFVFVPVTGLLSDGFAAERRALIDPAVAAAKPVPAGNPCPYEPGGCPAAATTTTLPGGSTTHLVTADRWGTVVSYTLTIEQTGGSGITVPERGFLLNNELTDFSFAPPGPNLPAPGKRPRSSMSPTIVLRDGAPLLAVGSPGGATIITTVAEILLLRLARDVPLPDAIAAPRASQRNTAAVQAEPAFIATLGPALQAYGHTFASTPEIGAATGIELLPDGSFLAAAEPARRGGGHAAVVRS